MKNYEMLINNLVSAYNNECKQISEDCREAGWPDHGSNYEMACTRLWEEYYLPEITALEEEELLENRREFDEGMNAYNAVVEAKEFINSSGINYIWDVLGQPGVTADWIRDQFERWIWTVAADRPNMAHGLWAVMSCGLVIEQYTNIQWHMPATKDCCQFLREEIPMSHLTLAWITPEDEEIVIG